MSLSRLIGVILAAGRGGRMGETKQLKTWRTPQGNKPLVAAAFDTIKPICDEMVVVLGHDSAEVADALGDRQFHRADSSADAPMFESIRAGLRVVYATDPDATVVLQPGDHPEVAWTSLIELFYWWVKRPERTIIPEFDGRGGHPTIIPAAVGKLILGSDCSEGLDKFWREHPDLCHRVAIDDPAVVRDVDTPADLA
jgi:molybdenum cofactor cytidylyltransferase